MAFFSKNPYYIIKRAGSTFTKNQYNISMDNRYQKLFETSELIWEFFLEDLLKFKGITKIQLI